LGGLQFEVTMTTAFNPKLTAAGLALFPQATQPGFSVTLTHVAIGTGLYTPAVDANGRATQTALTAEVARYAITSGSNPDSYSVQVGTTITDTDDTGRSPNGKSIGEIGFYCGNTLFAVWSQPSTPLFVKSATLDVPFAYTLDISILPAASVVVSVSTDTTGMASLINQHEAKTDPHPGYVLEKRGMGEWDTNVIYATGAHIINPGDGKTYRSLVDNNVGNNPTTATTKWERWGHSVAEMTAEFIPPRAGAQVGGATTTGMVRITNPDSAYFASNSNPLTGAFKIALPSAAATFNTLLRMRVELFDNSTGEAISIFIAGNATNTSFGWASVSVAVLGSLADRDFTVRFGNDGTSHCIWIGELASTWSYPRVHIAEVMASYNSDGGTVARWGFGWAITSVTAFGNLAVTKSGNLVFAQSDIARVAGLQSALDLKAPLASPALTGTPTAPSQAAADYTDRIATTKFFWDAFLGQASAVAPAMNGAATVGTSTSFARADHVHPTDTTRAPLASPTFTGTPAAPTAAQNTNTTQLATTAFVLGQASSTTPSMDGTAAVGTGTTFARADHVHPTDTSRAPLASPTFTGTPAAPTAAANTNTTQLATTAFVLGQASSTTPAMDGTAAVGTGTTFARADHVHPTDTTRAPLASPTFTGNPAAPTPTSGDNDTSLATTAFVQTAANGFLSKSVAGAVDVTLTAAEAGYATIKLTGAITANINVIVPAAAARWTIWNATSGAFSVTVKTSTGTGVAVTQGTTWQLLCDGTNVVDANSDFKDIALTGVPTAPTAAASTSTTQVATTAFVLGQASSTTPTMNGTAAVGTGTTFARADHVHPTDTTRAPLASPTFTGTPAAPTAAANTNTTQLATTAFVLGQASSTTPSMNGTAAVGTGTTFARADHVHPTDTTRAPLASPALTGTPTAPTPAQFDNDTSLATTAFVAASGVQFNPQTRYYSSATQLALAAADVGCRLFFNGASDQSVVLPDTSSLPVGATIYLAHGNTVGKKVTVTAFGGASNIDTNGGALVATATILYGEDLIATWSGVAWMLSGTAIFRLINFTLGASLVSSGYQKLPSGLIIQWGAFAGSSSGDTPITFPLAFPTAFLQGFVSGLNSGTGAWGGYNTPTKTGMNGNWWAAANTRQSGTAVYLVIGF
jgi:hypothetical protein